jgi:hypothetical protein
MRPQGQGKPSAQYADGYRLGLADARTGSFTIICGGSPEAAERAAGYQTGLLTGRRERHAAPEPEAGL